MVLVTMPTKTSMAMIKHIIASYGFINDCSMVEIIQHQEWTDLSDSIALMLDEVG
jgi:hypothetical protein